MIFILLLLPPVQSGIASFVTKKLNESYGVDIHIDKVSISIIGDISLKNVFILDHQKDTLISAGKLQTSITNYNKLLNGNLYFGNIYGKELNLYMNTYKGDSLSNLDIFIKSFDDGAPPSQAPFIMKSKNIKLENSRFRISDYNSAAPLQLDIDKLSASITDFSIHDSEIKLKLNSGSLIYDKSLEINNIKTDFVFNDTIINADKMRIVTPYSHIDADVVFKAGNDGFSDFLNKVELDAIVRKSTIGTPDLNSFYKGFSEDKMIDFQGDIRGALNDFEVENLQMTYQNTSLEGNIRFNNLLKDEQDIQIKGNIKKLTSIYTDLAGLMPELLGESLPENLRELGFFELGGNFDYTTKNLIVDMGISSQSGDLTIDGEIIDIDNLQNSSYKGTLSTYQLNVGKIIGQKDLGTLTSAIKFSGKSLDFNQIDKLFVDGDIQHLEYNNYPYKKIHIKGDLAKQNFKGNVSIKDENLKMSVDGLMQVDKKNTIYDFVADIEHANLTSLGFIKKDSIANLRGVVTIDVKGNTLDNMTGQIGFHNTIYEKNISKYLFQDFSIDVKLNDKNERTILINSPDIITGKVVGVFKFGELDKIIQNSFGSIYTNYKPFKISKGQYVSFDLKIYNKIVEIFLPDVVLGKNTFIKGNIMADEGDFKVNFKSPNISLFENNLKKVNLLVDNKNPLYNTYFEVEEIQNKLYNVSDFTLVNATIKDTLFFRTEFKGGDDNKDNYTLDFYHTINKERSSVVGLKKSNVFFKGKDWVLNKNNDKNRVVFDKNLDSIRIEKFKIEHQSQAISFDGKMAKDNYKDIHLVFDKVELFDITPEIEGFNFTGALNGHLSLMQQRNKYFPSSDLVIKDFTMNQYPMGDFELGVQGNDNLSAFKVNLQFINAQSEGFRTIGDIFIREGGTYLELDTSLQQLNLKPFANLTDGIFFGLRGNMTGSAHISGLITNPKVEGTIYLKDAGMGVSFLNIDVNFDPKSSITLKENKLIFNDIVLTDAAYNTQAILKGSVYHKKLSDWFLDIHLNTNNKRFLVLNTTELDNELFYGTAFIQGKADITGNIDNLALNVNAVTGDGTKFKIPLSDTRTVGDDSFINFVTKKKDNTQQVSDIKTFQGIEMNFDLDVLPSAEVEIIIDPKTGSNLIGRGAGTLLFEINTNGKFNMWGDFITTSGEYNFKYEGLIDKKFKVLPGGSITWNGDPLNAELTNLKAVYNLYTNPSVLLETNQHNRKIQTQVQVSLEGSLAKPQTIFDINFPDSNSSLISELNYRLQDTDKKQLQAFALLLQGNFLSDTSAGDKVVSYNMLETATGIFNQLLSREDDKLNLGITYEAGNVDPNQLQNYGDRLGITVSTKITDRVLLNGKLGIPIGGVTQTAIAGDFEIQFLLNEDGTLSAKIFNRENEVQQYLLDKIGYTQGVGLFYKVDFDTFKEFIQGIFKKGKKEEVNGN